MNSDRKFEAEIDEKMPDRPWGDMAVVADSDEDIDRDLVMAPEEEEPLPETVREPRAPSSRSQSAAGGSGPIA